MFEYPIINENYKHYKGGTYKVLSMAEHSETKEKMVVYQSIEFGGTYCRPLELWNEKTINGESRFEQINK